MIYRKWYDMSEDIQYVDYVPGVRYGRQSATGDIFRCDGATKYVLNVVYICPLGQFHFDPRLDLYLTENLDIYSKSELEALSHGRHRQAGAQNHGHPFGQPCPSPGGAQALGPGAALGAQQGSNTAAYQNALTVQSQANLQAQAQYYAALIQNQRARQSVASYMAQRHGLLSTYPPAPLPNTGPSPTDCLPTERGPMQVGEIIGYRVWRVIDGYLASMHVAECPWMPRDIMYGDVAEGYGVHAFKEPGAKFTEYALYYAQKYSDQAHGTIAMWGEVHEHEHGYRAEFARVKSITNATRSELLRDLVSRYISNKEPGS